MTFDLFPEVVPVVDDNDRRFTPRWFIEARHRVVRYTVDAASQADSPAAQVIGRFWTKEDDSLRLEWARERVWLNHPWSLCGEFVEKCWHEMAYGCELIDMLAPARTDRPWWQEMVEPHRDGRTPRVVGVTLTTTFLPRMPFGNPGNPLAVGVVDPNFWCVLCSWRLDR